MRPIGQIAEFLLNALQEKEYTTAAPAIEVRNHKARLNGAAQPVAATLDVPGDYRAGRERFILFIADNVDNAVTLAVTTPQGARTFTFSAVGDILILFGSSETGWSIWAKPAGAALVQTYATADATHAARTAPALTDNSGGGAADGTIAAVTVERGQHVQFTAPDAAGTTGGADQLDLNGVAEPSAMANPVSPDVPRNVTMLITDADNGIDAFSLTVTGFAPDGSAQTETFDETPGFPGAKSQVGSKIFSRITAYTLDSINGNGAADTLDVGFGTKLGVPVPAPTADLVIEALQVDGAKEAAAAVDQANNSVTPTTAPNGTRVFDVFYSYTDPIASGLRDAIAELATAYSALRVDQLDTAQFVNALVDALQAQDVVR